MKKKFYLFSLLITFLGYSWGQNPVTITIGTDDTENPNIIASPNNSYAESRRIQMVYTASEIRDILEEDGPINAVISSLAWEVSEDNTVDLLNYEIKIGHTSAINATAHIDVDFTLVKNAFTYAGNTGQLGWKTITFDQPFVWNGTDNIVIDVCWGVNTTYAQNGRVRMSSIVRGMRGVYNYYANACGETTTSTLTLRPRIQLTMQLDIPTADLVVRGLNRDYRLVPESQLVENFTIRASVINIGSSLTEPVNAIFTITDAEHSVLFTNEVPLALPIENSEEIEVESTEYFDQNSLTTGDYFIEYTAPYADDQNPADNTDVVQFTVTETLYAIDNGILAGAVGYSNPQTLGNKFEIFNDDIFSGAQIQWGPQFIGNDIVDFQLVLYKINASFQIESTIFTSDLFSREPSMQGQTIDYAVRPVAIGPGTYILAIKQLGDAYITIGRDGDLDAVFWLANNTGNPSHFNSVTNFGHLNFRMILKPTRIITFAVDDGENPLANAYVVVKQGQHIVFEGTTEVNGTTEAWLDEGSYTYSASAVGYNPVVDVPFSVSDDTTLPITLTDANSPICAISPESVTIPVVEVNTIYGPVTLTIQNQGAGTLIIDPENITLSGSDADQFQLTTFTETAHLLQGESVAISLIFAPTTVGEKSATIQILHNGANNPALVNVSGISADPAITAFPWIEDFDDSAFPPLGWRNVQLIPGTYAKWERSINFTHNNSPGALAHLDYNNEHNSWIVTPPIVLEDGKAYTLSFYERNQYVPGVHYGYSGVLISTGSGEAGNDDFVEVYESNEARPIYMRKTIHLEPYAGQTIYIAFVYQGTYAHRWRIDDVKVEETFEVQLSVNPAGAGTVTGTGYYAPNEVVEISALAAYGYGFVNWTDADDNVISTDANFTFSMPAENLAFIANFEEVMDKFNLTLNIHPSDAGTPEGAGIYFVGQQVIISALAAYGYEFVNWTDENNNVVSNQATYSFEMPAQDLTLTANFAQTSYSLILYANPAEGGSVNGAGSYVAGEEIQVEAIANEGFAFISWIDEDGITLSETPIFNFTMIAEDVVLTANFSDHTGTAVLNSENIQIFPNPAHKVINIHSEKIIRNIKIVDLTGKERLNISVNDLQVKLPVQLETGLYIVHILTSDGVMVKKLNIF